jgi:hypothetical protein
VIGKNQNMKIIICGATGFLGRNLVPALLSTQNEVTVLGRSIYKIKNIFKQDVAPLSWDQLDQRLPDEFDVIFNLAGENISPYYWTNSIKKRIKESRVNTTTQLVTWCLKSNNKKLHFYNASAIGIYGLQAASSTLPPPLTESSLVPKDNPPNFLSEVGQAWENAAKIAVDAHFPVTFMRFAVVLKRHEGMLKKLELPFALGLGCILGSGNQAFTWIHVDDLVRAILFLLKHPEITGPINLCAPGCVSQKEFVTLLADVMYRPLIFKMLTPLVNMLFGQMGRELLLGGQNIYPKRLIQLGFEFLYPNLFSALAHEWHR